MIIYKRIKKGNVMKTKGVYSDGDSKIKDLMENGVVFGFRNDQEYLTFKGLI